MIVSRGGWAACYRCQADVVVTVEGEPADTQGGAGIPGPVLATTLPSLFGSTNATVIG